jgi:cytosine/adenosine deaminase-related metal-dependent hydrolase
MDKYTLRARWILPVESSPIEGGQLSVAQGRITAVGKHAEEGGPVIDLGDAILLPGLVNAHTHLEFSAAERPLGNAGLSLPEWIRLVIGERKRGDRDAEAAIKAGLAESLAAGVTTIGDIATGIFEGIMEGTLGATTVTFQEAIGFSAGRVESVFADVERRLEATPSPKGVSPHAPYTVHPLLLERLVELAKSRNTPIAMHLAESREELQLLESRDGPFHELLEERSMWDADAIARGTTPLSYLQTLAAAPRSLVIHGNYLGDDEIAFLAANRERMSVVYCPRTQEYFRHEPFPLQPMLEAGVRVALGTDSRASNPDLNLYRELRFAASRHATVAPADVLRMATLSGAEALGLAACTGSLSDGKRADLLALRCPSNTSDVDEAIVGTELPTLGVWVAGRRVDRQPPAR